jgi:hypothetical protein
MSRNEYETLHKLSEVQMKTLAALLGQASNCCPPKSSCDPCPNGSDALFDLARLQLSFYDRMLGLLSAGGGSCGCATVPCCGAAKCKCGCGSKVPADPAVPADCCTTSSALSPVPAECLKFIAPKGGKAAAKFVLRNDNATTVEIDLAVTKFVERVSHTECDAVVTFHDAHGDPVTTPICLAAFQCIELWVQVELSAPCWTACTYWDAMLTAKGCGVCHELCLEIFVADGCVPEAAIEPIPAPEDCSDDLAARVKIAMIEAFGDKDVQKALKEAMKGGKG